MSFNQLKTIMHKTFAGFMAVWLSGVVFLLCCTTMNGKAADKEFCPLAKMSAHCDKAEKNKDSRVFTNQTRESEMDCCAFIPVFFDKNRKIETDQYAEAIAPAASVETPKLISVRPIITQTPSYRSAFLPKNNTFLKNCTFRI